MTARALSSTLQRAASRAPHRPSPYRREARRDRAPELPLDSDTFAKRYVAIHRGRYEKIVRNGTYDTYPHETPDGKSLRMSEIISPTPEEFLYHFQRVGGLYGWDRREKYQPGNKDYLNKLFARHGTRLFLFQINGGKRRPEDIGFCLVATIAEEGEPEETISYKKGLPKRALIKKYVEAKELPCKMEENAVEIYKFGLYPEATGRGYGNYFLGQMLRILIEREGFDIVYLDTRNTNHGGVVQFYERNGMEQFHEEFLPSDLVPSAPEHPRPEDNTRVTPVVSAPPQPGA